MNISVIADQSVFTNAIRQAEQVSNVTTMSGLMAPLDTTVQGRLDEAWGEITSLLKRCVEGGREKTVALYETVQLRVEQLIKESGSRSHDLEAVLIERLRQYQATFIDGMFKQVKSEVRIGATVLCISQIELNQKISLGGTLKACLTEAVALTSSGEMEVSATYTIPGQVKS
jgi:hypothetical protein